MPAPSPLRVSCLLATEDRPEFAGLTVYGWNNQTWPHKELVVCASDTPGDHAFLAELREKIPAGELNILPMVPKGTALGLKWQKCLEAATGDAVTLWADDDYSYPYRLDFQAKQMEATWDRFDVLIPRFTLIALNLQKMLCRPVLGVYIGTVMVKRDICLKTVPFEMKARKEVDTAWWRAIQEKLLTRIRERQCKHLVMAVYHKKNISNPAAKSDVAATGMPARLDEETRKVIDRARTAAGQ